MRCGVRRGVVQIQYVVGLAWRELRCSLCRRRELLSNNRLRGVKQFMLPAGGAKQVHISGRGEFKHVPCWRRKI